ncbi:ribonuclease Z (macronuclear) [Tetrahymena thermophila SB210]|uniref:ribonuclease Z n=1 Tax=Tetrahymena thermophila (strain SB210) TaxID=312017 RepID=Q22WP4_TETTS|nr:ribonuclease Z [Tetrahymena thermophila SB210]EAR89702.2 ribonuclease Z [Tetrahymena thermophila SB210]|eukprot:XP_001009947.2 ribonuclease Z [Tetrahymena thermophila SB210]
MKIENSCQESNREEAKQQDEENIKCEDGDEEEEEDNRGHKAKVRAQQLIQYLNATQQDINKSIAEFKQFLLSTLGIEEICFIPVIHCSQAYGVVFRHKSGVKISYSGDTRPCSEFAKVAEGSDLMIHEGTFNNDLLEHAKKARHSTATEAIEIAMQAKVKALVLTHLSKRHSKLDLGDFQDQTLEKNRFIKYQTALALDHLQFKLSEFYSLPFISKGVHSIFPDQDEK